MRKQLHLVAHVRACCASCGRAAAERRLKRFGGTTFYDDTPDVCILQKLLLASWIVRPVFARMAALASFGLALAFFPADADAFLPSGAFFLVNKRLL